MTPDSEKRTEDLDLLRSDPAQRRKIKWLMVTMAVIALCLFLFGRPLLKRWMDVSDTALMLHRMGLVFYGLAVILFATAAYAGWYASRIFRSSQFPPPGTWVLRDTRLLRGDHARARGWWVVACAISFAVLGAYTLILPQRLDRLVKPGATLPSPQAISPNG